MTVHRCSWWLVLLTGSAFGFTGCNHDSPPDSGPKDAHGDAGPNFNPLEIVHIDVGEGDATLFIGPDGTTLLVDGGPAGSGADILAVLQAKGVHHLDTLVATHPDEDHIGGFSEVIHGGIGVSRAFGNGATASTQVYTDLVQALKATAADHLVSLPPASSIDLGNGAVARCTAVGGVLENGTDLSVSDDNDLSVALHLRYGRFDYHVGGDLGGGGQGQADVETPLGRIIGDMDVVHLHHHGSDSSTNANWLNSTRPEVVVISVGPNGYGHPGSGVVTRLTGGDSAVHVPLPEIVQTGQGASSPGKVLHTFSITTDGATYTLDGQTREVDEP